jgi:pimeloyl-ACP methyl ester carboxylesterase
MAELNYHAAALPQPEAVTIDGGDVMLAGSFYDNVSDGRCAILMLHGYTSTRYGVLQFADPFWQRGCDLLAYDARGHGQSSDAYQDFRTIVMHQAAEQFGQWTGPFVPGAFFVAQLRADFSADDVSPQNAVIGANIPILLIHAQADTFTPPSHSETIYIRSNPATTELHLTPYGTAHARSIIDDYEAYKELVDTFLDDKVPGFGVANGN